MTIDTESPARRGVSVVPHLLSETQEWPDSMGVMSANGALIIWHFSQHGRPDGVPTKIYAPGFWQEMTHYGQFMVPPPAGRPAAEQDAERQRLASQHVEDLSAQDPQELERDRRRAYTDPIEELSPERLDQTNGDVKNTGRRSDMGVIPATARPVIRSDQAPPPFRDEEDDADDCESRFSLIARAGGVALRSGARTVSQWPGRMRRPTSYDLRPVADLVRPTWPESLWAVAVLLLALPVIWLTLG